MPTYWDDFVNKNPRTEWEDDRAYLERFFGWLAGQNKEYLVFPAPSFRSWPEWKVLEEAVESAPWPYVEPLVKAARALVKRAKEE